MSRLGRESFLLYLEVRRADILSLPEHVRGEKLAALEDTERISRRILEREDCLSLRELAIGGQDLIADGMRPGRAIGAVLGSLLDEVLDDPRANRKEILLEKSRALRETMG